MYTLPHQAPTTPTRAPGTKNTGAYMIMAKNFVSIWNVAAEMCSMTEATRQKQNLTYEIPEAVGEGVIYCVSVSGDTGDDTGCWQGN